MLQTPIATLTWTITFAYFFKDSWQFVYICSYNSIRILPNNSSCQFFYKSQQQLLFFRVGFSNSTLVHYNVSWPWFLSKTRKRDLKTPYHWKQFLHDNESHKTCSGSFSITSTSPMLNPMTPGSITQLSTTLNKLSLQNSAGTN